MPDRIIRDFIYLDVERVRSFVAQLKEGLPSERTREAEHEAGGKAAAEAGLPLITKGSGEINYHYLRSHSETSSLHDFIFEELYSNPIVDGT